MSDTVILAIIAIVPSTLAAILSFLALNKARATHLLVNSRMDELLKITKSASRAEGVIEGKAER
jgi:hypothetical protein